MKNFKFCSYVVGGPGRAGRWRWLLQYLQEAPIIFCIGQRVFAESNLIQTFQKSSSWMCCSIHHGRFRRKLIVISVRGQWILWSRELLTNSSRSYSDHWEYENSHRIKRVYFFHAVHLGIVFIHTFYFLKQATKQKRIHVQNCGGTFKIIFRDFTFFFASLKCSGYRNGFFFFASLKCIGCIHVRSLCTALTKKP